MNLKWWWENYYLWEEQVMQLWGFTLSDLKERLNLFEQIKALRIAVEKCCEDVEYIKNNVGNNEQFKENNNNKDVDAILNGKPKKLSTDKNVPLSSQHLMRDKTQLYVTIQIGLYLHPP